MQNILWVGKSYAREEFMMGIIAERTELKCYFTGNVKDAKSYIDSEEFKGVYIGNLDIKSGYGSFSVEAKWHRSNKGIYVIEHAIKHNMPVLVHEDIDSTHDYNTKKAEKKGATIVLALCSGGSIDERVNLFEKTFL